ncbi:MAG: TetR/AcrR family transcriptional regulator, partial [Planctomycetia bacterium]|nr:TetR/AcrR family transcriptional regulator [Planctomycetia bacterium]
FSSDSMSENPPARDYHHGDLRRALVAAGLEILERDGVEGLSLRAVARQAQVSHNAPYHHFADKAELLAAVAAAGFEALSESIARQVAAAPADSFLDGLRGVGRGYLLFAAARPAVFRLMFRPELTRPAEHPLLKEAQARAFGLLVSQVAGCQQSGELPGADPLPPAAMCWSMVHGLAVLRVEQVLDETPLGGIPFEQLAAMAVEAAIRGVSGG